MVEILKIKPSDFDDILLKCERLTVKLKWQVAFDKIVTLCRFIKAQINFNSYNYSNKTKK